MSKKEYYVLHFIHAFCWAFLIALLLSVGGCACFQSGRIEARADYHIMAEDATVSIVAVGYTHNE